jgi:hypothetical protein
MKKNIMLLLLLFFAGAAMAQKITGIRFGYFVTGAGPNKPAANTITVAGYTGQTENESFVSENPKTAAALIALIKKLKANGTEDINKCFTPRHCITLIDGETVVYRALICFECDGIRFSNEKKTSAIKSAGNREKWMQELKRYFTSAHFDMNGITKK